MAPSGLSEDGRLPEREKLAVCHDGLMSAYVRLLALSESYVHDPAAAEKRLGESVDSGVVRWYVQRHVQQRLTELGRIYAGMALVTRSGDSYRDWLSDVQSTMTEARHSLKPLALSRFAKPAAILGAGATAAGVVEKLDLSKPAGVVLLALGGLLAFIGGMLGLIYLYLLYTSFRAKRALFTDGGVYAKENALFGALGVAKRQEPVSDLNVLAVFITVAALFAWGYASLVGAPILVAAFIAEALWAIAVIILSGVRRRVEKSRAPR